MRCLFTYVYIYIRLLKQYKFKMQLSVRLLWRSCEYIANYYMRMCVNTHTCVCARVCVFKLRIVPHDNTSLTLW